MTTFFFILSACNNNGKRFTTTGNFYWKKRYTPFFLWTKKYSVRTDKKTPGMHQIILNSKKKKKEYKKNIADNQLYPLGSIHPVFVVLLVFTARLAAFFRDTVQVAALAFLLVIPLLFLLSVLLLFQR